MKTKNSVVKIASSFVLGALLLLSANCEQGCKKQDAKTPEDSKEAKSEQQDLQPYKDRLKAEWTTLKEDVKREWHQFTDEDLAEINGEFDNMVNALRKQYYKTSEEAERKIKEFLDKTKNQ